MPTENQFTDAHVKPSMVKSEERADLHLDGELNLSDYVKDVPPSSKTVREVRQWTARKRETARTKLAMRLSTLFAMTLTSTLVLTGLAAFNENADKAFIKDIIPLLITPQVTLLGVAITFYFTSKDEE